MSFFMARDRQRFNYDAEVIRGARALELRHSVRVSCCSWGKHGQVQEKRIERQRAARFHEACRLSPTTIEGAIKVRNEVSTAIANRDCC